MGIEQKAVIRITAEQAEALKLISDLQKQLQTDFRSIANDAKKMSDDVNKSMGGMDKASSMLSSAWGKLKGAWLEIAAAVTAVSFLKNWVKDAIGAEESFRKLKFQIEELGIAYDSVSKSVENSIQKTSLYARKQDEDVAEVLQQMILITGDLAGSQENLNLVYDLAVQKGIDIQTSMRIVGAAMTGNLEPMGRYFFQFKNLNETLGENVTVSDKATVGVKALQDMVGGSAGAVSEHIAVADEFTLSIAALTQGVGNLALRMFDLSIMRPLKWITDDKKVVEDFNNISEVIKIVNEVIDETGEASSVTAEKVKDLSKLITDKGKSANLSEEGIRRVVEKVTVAYIEQGGIVGKNDKERKASSKQISDLIEDEIKAVKKQADAEKEANEKRMKSEEDYINATKKLESEKRKEIIANQNEILKNLKDTLTLAEKAYETYKAEVIRIQKEISSTRASDAEFLTSLSRKFLDEDKKANLERLDSERVLAEAKKAFAKGDLDRAKELFEKSKEGYKDLATYAKDESDKFAGTNTKIKDEVVKGYTAAAKGLQDVLSAQSDLAVSGLDDASKLAADTQTKFDDLQKQIEELKRIDKKIEMEILVKGYEEALAKKAELEKPTSSTHTIHTVYAGQNAPRGSNEAIDADLNQYFQGLSEGGDVQPIKAADGRHFSGYGGGDRIPILGEAGEYMMRKESVRSWGKGLFDMLNSVNPSAGIRGLSNATGTSSGAMDKLAVDLNLGGKTFGMTTDKSTGQDFAGQIKKLNILRGRYKQPY